MGDIKYIDHTADIIVECSGYDLKDAFITAIKALYGIMLNIEKVKPVSSIEIKINAIDLEELLLKWLEEFLILFDSESLVFSKFEILKLENNSNVWYLHAKCWGEQFDPQKHEFKTGVKAATYSEMSIKKQDGQWKFHFVLDL